MLRLCLVGALHIQQRKVEGRVVAVAAEELCRGEQHPTLTDSPKKTAKLPRQKGPAVAAGAARALPHKAKHYPLLPMDNPKQAAKLTKQKGPAVVVRAELALSHKSKHSPILPLDSPQKRVSALRHKDPGVAAEDDLLEPK